MPEIGQNIAHYRITEKLGEGGMGVVYRAEDTNLGRQVAVKVLPDIFSGDPERLARFEREARLLASLNHPNIAGIYGLEQAEGKRFLAMELVEGETLAQRIARGPLPVEEALEVCRQIAEGVEAAHEKGIIHRDLKPANIKITPEGKVKILDFGLAKAFQEEPAAADLSQSPTLTAAMTRAGVILGTAAYMSPEQAKGKPVDKRADIWAFGCVLYECLTAKRALAGETVTETMAAVLARDPAWDTLPAATPRRIRDLLRRCLQKDRQFRLRDIGDARIELREVNIGESASAPDLPVAHDGRRGILPWIVATIGFALAGIVLWTTSPWEKSPEAGRASSRLNVNLPAAAPLAPTGSMPLAVGQPSLALSPDGRYLAYVALVDGRTQLYLRDMRSGEYKSLAGTEGAHSPFFSPEGDWVAFFAGERLKKVAVAGGEPTVLAVTYSLTSGGAWGLDGYIYFNPDQLNGFRKVSAHGGQPQILPDTTGQTFGYPSDLPGG